MEHLTREVVVQRVPYAHVLRTMKEALTMDVRE